MVSCYKLKEEDDEIMYRTQLFSNNKEIIASGTAISFNDEPITIKLFDDAQQVVLMQFSFEKDTEDKNQRMQTSIADDTLIFTLVNFDNPLGTGTNKPINFASYNSKTLYIHFRVTSLQDSDRTLYYSIYAEEAECNGN